MKMSARSRKNTVKHYSHAWGLTKHGNEVSALAIELTISSRGSSKEGKSQFDVLAVERARGKKSRKASGSPPEGGSRQASSGWWSQRDLNPCLSLERAPC